MLQHALFLLALHAEKNDRRAGFRNSVDVYGLAWEWHAKLSRDLENGEVSRANIPEKLQVTSEGQIMSSQQEESC
jgi:hypothetical protein